MEAINNCQVIELTFKDHPPFDKIVKLNYYTKCDGIMCVDLKLDIFIITQSVNKPIHVIEAISTPPMVSFCSNHPPTLGIYHVYIYISSNSKQ